MYKLGSIVNRGELEGQFDKNGLPPKIYSKFPGGIDKEYHGPNRILLDSGEIPEEKESDFDDMGICLYEVEYNLQRAISILLKSDGLIEPDETRLHFLNTLFLLKNMTSDLESYYSFLFKKENDPEE
jgi:hypothetical protein